MKAKRKLILLFSDAKPSDYDEYEGPHGLGDVRKAIKEIRTKGTFVKAITIAKENHQNQNSMFGSGQYQTLQHPNQIANAILQIFTEMMAYE